MKNKLIWLLLLSTLVAAETKTAPKAAPAVDAKPEVVKPVPNDIAKNLIIAYQKAAIAKKDAEAAQRVYSDAVATFGKDVDYLKKLEADTSKMLGYPEGTDYNVNWDEMTAKPIFPPKKDEAAKPEVTAVPAEKK